MAIITNFSDLDLTKEYSYSDYLLWHFQERVELIKGFILKMSPAPSMVHQRISNNLSFELNNYFRRKQCDVFVAPFDVRLSIPSDKKDSTVVQPDLCIICDESKLDARGCNGTPDLIVEIVSSNNSKHDLHTKFNLYQEAGVKEYWIIEPNDKMILVYNLVKDEFIGLKPQVEGETIRSPLFPELDIALEDVFYKV
jgi:Uma2 family endonuclease